MNTDKETDPTRVTSFEIECLDGVFRPVYGTAHHADKDTGCRVHACSDSAAIAGMQYKVYGVLAAQKQLEDLSAMAHGRKVRFAK